MKFVENLMAKKRTMAFMLAMSVIVLTTVVAFAAESGASGSDLSGIAITTEMLNPLVEGVMSNVQVILPVGLGLFAIFLGIRIIPGLITRFIRM